MQQPRVVYLSKYIFVHIVQYYRALRLFTYLTIYVVDLARRAYVS